MRAAWFTVKAAALAAVFSAAPFNCAPNAKAASGNGAETGAQPGGIDSGPTAPMRASYRSGDFEAAAKQFEEINASDAPDSVKYHAYYIMGQTSLRRDDYQNARRFFTMVPDNHPDYAFARHAAAIASVRAGDIRNAVTDLELAVKTKPKNAAQREIINRSYVFLGFVFYADRSMTEAITMLRKVPKNSRHYYDALIGAGWTYLQMRNWGDCLNAGAELANTAADPVVRSEGNLMQAYSLAFQKSYGRAVNRLDDALGLLSSCPAQSEPEPAAGGDEYEYGAQLFFSRDAEQLKDEIELVRPRFAKIAAASHHGTSAKKSVEDEIERLKEGLESEELKKGLDAVK